MNWNFLSENSLARYDKHLIYSPLPIFPWMFLMGWLYTTSCTPVYCALNFSADQLHFLAVIISGYVPVGGLLTTKGTVYC